MTALTILVPVLNRPHRVQPLLESIAASTPDPFSVLFITDDHDRKTHAQIARYEAPGVSMISPGGTYANKIACGVEHTDSPYVFLGADDLHFHRGWLEAALAYRAEVVGVNDLLERRHRPNHATHFLMTRDYAEATTIDGGRGPLHHGYAHWFVDDELIATATKRGVYTYAPDSHVEHLHPQGGKAQDDATYAKGRANRRADRNLFLSRKSLWA